MTVVTGQGYNLWEYVRGMQQRSFGRKREAFMREYEGGPNPSVMNLVSILAGSLVKSSMNLLIVMSVFPNNVKTHWAPCPQN